jgi:microcystin-dependent protein
MAYIGKNPTSVPLTSNDLQDGIVTSAKLDSAVATISTGTIISYSNGTLPTGYLDCDGSAVSRTTYADLFAVVSTTYGVGDGSSTFNLPDLQNNHPIGVSGTKALGTKAGSTSTTLAETNLATHTHTIYKTNYTAAQVNIGAVQGRQLAYQTTSSVANAGSGTAIDTFPPYIALKFMIKT